MLWLQASLALLLLPFMTSGSFPLICLEVNFLLGGNTVSCTVTAEGGSTVMTHLEGFSVVGHRVCEGSGCPGLIFLFLARHRTLAVLRSRPTASIGPATTFSHRRKWGPCIRNMSGSCVISESFASMLFKLFSNTE